MEDIHRITLVKGRNDLWMWNDGEDRIFTIKSTYKKLQGAYIVDKRQFLNCLWKVKAIPYAKFFVLRVS